MHLTRTPIKLAIIALSVIAFFFFAIRDASMGGVDFAFEGLLLEGALYGIPLVIFAFVLWTSNWREMTHAPGLLRFRSLIAIAAQLMVLASSALYLLTLPFTSVIAQKESLGAGWIYLGFGCSIGGAACSLAGSPRRWFNAVASAVLAPCWFFLAALMVKMMID